MPKAKSAAEAATMDLSSPPVIGALVAVLLTTLFVLSKLLGSKKPTGPKFLNKQRQQLLLGERKNLSHDTVLFRFTLPKSAPVLGLPVGKHFKIFCPNATPKIKGKWNGREDPESDVDEIERKYTPTTSDDEIGHVDLVIKVYKGGVKEQFVDGGKMSQYMDTLKVGDSLTLSGPWGMNEYLGQGKFKIGTKQLATTKLGMMSGGTGITPMLQVLAAILKDPKDKTEVSLIYANQTEDDILVRDMLEAYAAKYPKRFKLWYTLDRPPEGWKYSTGFITEAMIKEHLPPPETNPVILMCGPPPMVKFACIQNLDKLGYTKQMQVQF